MESTTNSYWFCSSDPIVPNFITSVIFYVAGQTRQSSQILPIFVIALFMVCVCVCVCVQGEELSLTRHPNELEYVLEALRNNSKPVIILCKE